MLRRSNCLLAQLYTTLYISSSSWLVASGPKFDSNLALHKSWWQASFMAHKLLFPFFKRNIDDFIITMPCCHIFLSFRLLWIFFLAKNCICVMFSFTVSVSMNKGLVSDDDRISSRFMPQSLFLICLLETQNSFTFYTLLSQKQLLFYDSFWV